MRKHVHQQVLWPVQLTFWTWMVKTLGGTPVRCSLKRPVSCSGGWNLCFALFSIPSWYSFTTWCSEVCQPVGVWYAWILNPTMTNFHLHWTCWPPRPIETMATVFYIDLWLLSCVVTEALLPWMEKHVKAGPFSNLKFVYFKVRKSVHSKIAVSGGLLMCVCAFSPAMGTC